MNSIVEAKVNDLLKHDFHFRAYDCGTVIECIRSLAQAAGYDLDDRFAHAGLGAGPEARIASVIVDRALLGGGCEAPDYAIKQEVDRWIRSHPRKGLH